MNLKRQSPFPVLLLTLALSISVPCALAEPVPNNYSGTWTEHFKDGGIKSETNYKNGKKMGISILWYKPGCPMSVHFFKNDVLDGPTIKWEKCEGIVAIGEYKDNSPWNGYFLVNPANAYPITSTTVRDRGFPYYVMEYTDGIPYKTLSKTMLEHEVDSKPIFRKLIERLNQKSKK